jgi:hypothetical protein
MSMDRTRYALTLLLSLAFAFFIVWAARVPVKES